MNKINFLLLVIPSLLLSSELREIYQERMKDRQIDQEGSSNFSIGASGIDERQDVRENGKFEAKPTQAQSDSSFMSGVHIHCMPYIYSEIMNQGYGANLRLETSQHNLEIASIYFPASGGWFSHKKTLGYTCSYFYALFPNKDFRPYAGLSYTYLDDKLGSSWENCGSFDGHQLRKWQEFSYSTSHQVSPLVGVIYSPNHTPVYCFVDILGPMTILTIEKDSYFKRSQNEKFQEETYTFYSSAELLVTPRFGFGFSF